MSSGFDAEPEEDVRFSFSGHMDTVPRRIDRWKRPRFAGLVEEERLYGLGAFDMKAGLVAGLLAYRVLHDLDWPLKGDLLLESVVDEEFGGANGTLACRVKGVRADLAVVAEPTNGVICPSHRRGAMLRFTFIGRAEHFVGSTISSTQTPNPILAAVNYVALLEEFNAQRNRRSVPSDFADSPDLPMERVQRVAGDLRYPMGDRNPGRAYLTVWFECDPDVSLEDLLGDLRHFTEPRMAEDPVLSRMPLVIEPQLRFLEGSRMPQDHPGIGLLSQVAYEVTGARLHGSQEPPSHAIRSSSTATVPPQRCSTDRGEATRTPPTNMSSSRISCILSRPSLFLP